MLALAGLLRDLGVAGLGAREASASTRCWRPSGASRELVRQIEVELRRRDLKVPEIACSRRPARQPVAPSGRRARRALRMPDRRPHAADRCERTYFDVQRPQAGPARPGAGQSALQQGEVLPRGKLSLDLEPMSGEEATTMSVRVRPLEARDKPVWLTLFKGYIEFYQATVPEDVIETLWQRLMRGEEGFHIGPRRRRRRRHASRPGARAVPPLHLVERLLLLPGGPVRRSGAARQGHRPGLDRGRLRPRPTPSGCSRTYWMTQETQRDGPRALRPGGDQIAVRAVSADRCQACQTLRVTTP